MGQRKFKIRENLLTPTPSTMKGMMLPAGEPMTEISRIRYNLVIRAMEKSFSSTDDLEDYVLKLEDFIYSADSPNPFFPSE